MITIRLGRTLLDLSFFLRMRAGTWVSGSSFGAIWQSALLSPKSNLPWNWSSNFSELTPNRWRLASNAYIVVDQCTTLDTVLIEEKDQLHALNFESIAFYSMAFRPLFIVQYYHYKLRLSLFFLVKMLNFINFFTFCFIKLIPENNHCISLCDSSQTAVPGSGSLNLPFSKRQ